MRSLVRARPSQPIINRGEQSCFLETKREGEAQTIPGKEPWRELLLKAADEMERRGHCVGEYMDKAGAVCIIGALRTIEKIPFEGPPTPDVNLAVRKFGSFVEEPAIMFNDNHTQSEVLATIRACANAD